MPRIYDSTSDPLDFCQRCFPSESVAKKRYANLGDGPDDRGNCFEYNADHPDYSDTDYHCQTCNRKLGDRDNGNFE
jgi:hypothetical protein